MPLWCTGRSETPSETRDRCERLDARRGDQNERLGFQLDFDGPAGDVYYAGVSRDGIGIMLKEILPDVLPCPNHTRHPWLVGTRTFTQWTRTRSSTSSASAVCRS